MLYTKLGRGLSMGERRFDKVIFIMEPRIIFKLGRNLYAGEVYGLFFYVGGLVYLAMLIIWYRFRKNHIIKNR